LLLVKLWQMPQWVVLSLYLRERGVQTTTLGAVDAAGLSLFSVAVQLVARQGTTAVTFRVLVVLREQDAGARQ